MTAPTSMVDGYAFAPTFSIWTTIEECLNPPIVFDRARGGFFTTEPFSEPEVFTFPDGIGPLECVNVEHEEVLLMPRWIDCNRVTFKYGLGTSSSNVLRVLHQVGSRRDGPGAGARRRGEPSGRGRRVPSGPGAARRQDARHDVRRHARHWHRHGRRAASDVPVPRGRQRRLDARLRMPGGRVADGAQPRDRARARRRPARGRVRACSAPRRSTPCRSSTCSPEYGSPHAMEERQPAG